MHFRLLLTNSRLDFLYGRLRLAVLVLVKQEAGEVKEKRLRVHFSRVTLKTGAIHHSLRYG